MSESVKPGESFLCESCAPEITNVFPYPISSLWRRYDSNPCFGLTYLALFQNAKVLVFVAQIIFKSWDRYYTSPRWRSSADVVCRSPVQMLYFLSKYTFRQPVSQNVNRSAIFGHFCQNLNQKLNS